MPVQFISEDPNGEKGILDDFLATVQFLLNEPTTPNVVTTSYGLSETDDEESVPLLMYVYQSALAARIIMLKVVTIK